MTDVKQRPLRPEDQNSEDGQTASGRNAGSNPVGTVVGALGGAAAGAVGGIAAGPVGSLAGAVVGAATGAAAASGSLTNSTYGPVMGSSGDDATGSPDPIAPDAAGTPSAGKNEGQA